ncbi:polymer-forming cytoskeletal protein [Patescibacteria group bacterium]|nr:polymer-forming cytoskeletal protein [Patescibacteria group bacterium]MBU1931735.1 polymer-forming cytoskeletal protein [Patescibacteria group bacterium]
MKRHILFFIFLLSLVLFLAPSVRAEVISSKKEAVVAKEEVIDDDLFVTGESVIIEGTINGDLYAVGQNIKISGTVNGDVVAAGGTLEITGEIKDDVRVAGESINIQGAFIGDSLTVVGRNVNVKEGSTVGGGILFGAGLVNLSTDVARGIMGGGRSVNIDGSVGKDIYIATEQLTLGSNTVVAGDLTYYSAEKEEGLLRTATVSGRVSHILPTQKKATAEITKPELVKTKGRKFKFMIRLWSYLAALVVGSLVLYLFRKPSQQIASSLEKNWLANLGWGFLLIILASPAFIMLMITGIGLPLAVILGLLFVIDLYLSKLVVGMVLGRKLKSLLPKQKMSIYLSFALGLAIYYVFSALPILGDFVQLMALLLGLGTLFSYQKSQLLKNR